MEPAVTNFSTPDLNESYVSDGSYEEGFLDGTVLLLIQSLFQSLFKEDILPQEFYDKIDFDDPSLFLEEISSNWGDLVNHNWRFCFAIVFGLIVAIITPIAGMIWCSVSCCCPGRPKLQSSSDSVCIGIGVFFLMATSVALGLVGFVWYLVSQETLHDGVEILPQRIDDAVLDVNLFIDNTMKQIDYLAVDNFDELRTEFKNEVNRTGIVMETLFNKIETDIELEKLIELSREIIGRALIFNNETIAGVDRIVQDLTTQVDALKVEVNNITSLVKTVCNIPCQNLTQSMETINETVFSFSLPSVNLSSVKIPENVEAAVKDFSRIVDDAENLLDSFSSDFIANYTKDIDDKLDEIQETIKREIDNLGGEIKNLSLSSSDVMSTNFYDAIDLFTSVISPVLLIPIVVSEIIILILAIASVIGCCGVAGGKVKRVGSLGLGTSLILFFIFGFFLWFLTVVLFAPGTLTEKIVCETVRNPDESELGPKLNEYIQEVLQGFSNSSTNITLSNILKRCEGEGEGSYTLFDIKSIYDIEQLNRWQEDYHVDKLIADLKLAIEEALNSAVKSTQQGDDIQGDLNAINQTLWNAKSKVFDEFKNVDLDTLLNKTSAEMLLEGFEDLNNTLGTFTEVITGLENILGTFDTVNQTIQDLLLVEQDPVFDLPEKVEEALSILRNASHHIDTSGRREVMSTTNETIVKVVDIIDDFVDHVISFMTQDVGRCGVVHKIYDAFLVVGLCRDVVGAFNGLWSGLGLILLFLLPGLFISCCLRNLYNREKRESSYRTSNFMNPAMATQAIPEYYTGKNNSKK